jgi:hypothetical protein
VKVSTSALREQVERKLDEFNDQQLAELLRYIEIMESNVLQDDYDEDKDPTIGFISGPTDLASRAKEILCDENTFRSGWTQKRN